MTIRGSLDYTTKEQADGSVVLHATDIDSDEGEENIHVSVDLEKVQQDWEDFELMSSLHDIDLELSAFTMLKALEFLTKVGTIEKDIGLIVLKLSGGLYHSLKHNFTVQAKMNGDDVNEDDLLDFDEAQDFIEADELD